MLVRYNLPSLLFQCPFFDGRFENIFEPEQSQISSFVGNKIRDKLENEQDFLKILQKLKTDGCEVKSTREQKLGRISARFIAGDEL